MIGIIAAALLAVSTPAAVAEEEIPQAVFNATCKTYLNGNISAPYACQIALIPQSDGNLVVGFVTVDNWVAFAGPLNEETLTVQAVATKSTDFVPATGQCAVNEEGLTCAAQLSTSTETTTFGVHAVPVPGQ